MPPVGTMPFWLVIAIAAMLVFAALRVIAASIENGRARHQLMLDVRALQQMQLDRIHELNAERERKQLERLAKSNGTAIPIKPSADATAAGAPDEPLQQAA